MIVLTILGVIGKILLCALFLILAFLLLLLFVPVCYRAEGHVDDPSPHEEPEMEQALSRENTAASFHFSWLFSFVRGGISWPDKPEFQVYVLGFRVFPGNRDSASRKANVRKKRKGKAPSPAGEDTMNGGKQSAAADTDHLGKTELQTGSGAGTRKTNAKEPEGFSETDGKRAGGANRLSLKFICAKIKKASYKVRRFAIILRSENTERAVHKTAHHVAKIVRRLMPRHFYITGTAGLGDPERAGILLAVLGMMYPITGNCVQIRPEFMAYQMDLHGEAKGRICLISIVAAAVSLLADKSVRVTLRRLKEIKKHG